MNNRVRWLLSSACLVISVNAMADSCYDLYALPETKFMAVATSNPTAVSSTLNACISQQACSTSSNPALCMQNLYYYDAMATYYAYAGNASVHASATPSAPAVVSTSPTPTTATPAPLAPSNANQPMIIVPNPAADNGPSDTSSDGSTNNIYQNIKF